MHSASFRWALLLFGGLTVLAPSARAQTNLPTVTANPITVPSQLLTVEQRENVDNGRDGREYALSWSVTNGAGFRYRISFNRNDIRSSPRRLVPVIGTTDPEGSANGINSVLVAEDDLLEFIASSTTANPDDPDDPVFTNEGDLIIHLLVFQVDDDPTSGEEGNVVRDTWNFQFDFQAPDAPPLERVTPGERSVDVQWDSPGATDIQFYQVDYCPNVTLETVQRLTTATLDPNLVNNTSGAEAFELLMMPCDDTSGLESRSSIRETEDNITISDGIEEGTWVAFSLFAQDESPFLNLTTESPVYAVRTEVATDFWERQRELGGGEDGGFCFVATAAHGSYAHPVVGLLRGLRDQVLGRLPFGRALTRAYYTVSPPLASAIDGRPALAEAARWGLLGFVLGLLGLALSVAGVLAAWISSAARRWARAGALVGVIAASFPGSASAQVRGDATGIVGVGLEFKAGPYLPEIAKDLEDGGLPAFEEIHGAGRTRVLVNVGGEIQFLRGNFGTLSLGGTVGFIAWEGKALVEDAGGFLRPAANGSTTFNIVPMTLTLGYRFDLLMDRTPVPLAPYVRAGLAYHIFWNTRDDGSLSRFTVDGEEREALGARPGFVGTLGISLALNAIDPNGAARFRGTTGIRTSYLFFEGQLSQVDGFGDDSNFDFSDLTWFAGLMLEI